MSQLGPRAIVFLFQQSLHPDAVRHAALIVLAGSAATFEHDRAAWNAEPERSLVPALLGGDVETFDAIVVEARRLIPTPYEAKPAA